MAELREFLDMTIELQKRPISEQIEIVFDKVLQAANGIDGAPPSVLNEIKITLLGCYTHLFMIACEVKELEDEKVTTS